MECVTGHTIKDCIPKSANGPLPSLDLMRFVSNECGALPLSSWLSPGKWQRPRGKGGKRQLCQGRGGGLGLAPGTQRLDLFTRVPDAPRDEQRL